MKTRDSYTVRGLKQIRRTLDGTQPKDTIGAVMALDHLIAHIEEYAKENRQTRRKWVRQFAEQVGSVRDKAKRDYSRRESLRTACQIYEQSRRYHAQRAGDFARAIIDG